MLHTFNEYVVVFSSYINLASVCTPFPLTSGVSYIAIIRSSKRTSSQASLVAQYTPSHAGCSEAAELLLGAGADSSIQDHYGQTALHLAARHGHLDITNKLLATKVQREIIVT